MLLLPIIDGRRDLIRPSLQESDPTPFNYTRMLAIFHGEKGTIRENRAKNVELLIQFVNLGPMGEVASGNGGGYNIIGVMSAGGQVFPGYPNDMGRKVIRREPEPV